MLINEIKNQRIQAMKDRDVLKKGVLSALIGDSEKLAKDLRQDVPTNDQIIIIIKKYISNAKVNLSVCKPEDIDIYQNEIDILEHFLPQQMDEEELAYLIRELSVELNVEGKESIGPIMKELKARYGGQFDNKMACGLIGKILF